MSVRLGARAERCNIDHQSGGMKAKLQLAGLGCTTLHCEWCRKKGPRKR